MNFKNKKPNTNLKPIRTKFEGNLNIYLFVAWGFIVHLVLLWGVLDANFHSPVIQGLPTIEAPSNAPAKRVVLFVADGLRFRTFIENPPDYLGNIMKNHGVWGISHTQVPTESRPGHVALVAGLYEDPSAIFKGWKENPVDFDSIFNQSKFTWAWGSPDIISIFTKGIKGNVKGKSYPSEWQDFNPKPDKIFNLDKWVFDEYQNWLKLLSHQIKNLDGIILFLHLLGCDTIGHAVKPYSREYVDSMKHVDRSIQEAVNKTEMFFDDNNTVYVFTADHGMTDWGSHGSGSPDETETPFIAWGAGVSSSGLRNDIKQADIAPFISSLIGISIPANNEGVLPWQFFDKSYELYSAQYFLNNIKQLWLQVKENRILSCAKAPIYSDHQKSSEKILNDLVTRMERNLDQRNVREVIKDGERAMQLTKKLLYYYRHYQKNRLLVYLSFMWFGWMIFLLLKIIGQKRNNIQQSFFKLNSLGFLCIFIIHLVEQKLSGCGNWRLPYFAFFALGSMWLGIRNILLFSPKLITHDRKVFCIELLGIALLLITMITGLMYRWALSIGILFTAILYKLLIPDIKRIFYITAVILAIFTLLPVVQPKANIYVILFGIGFVTFIVAMNEKSYKRKIIELVRILITTLVYIEIIDGRKWVSWTILFTTPLSIWCYPLEINERIKGIVLGLFCPLVLLSASYEPLFFLTLAIHLLHWPQLDHSELTENKILTMEDFVKIATFMLYTLLCFFGTGNMASLSSFDPSWTRHFVTVFSPFTMFSLIIFKLSIPLLLLGCFSYLLGSRKSFLAVLLLGDCLSLPFVYYVTPEGSWLDIGSAISRLTIAVTLPCLLFLLHYLSRPLMTIKLPKFVYKEKLHIV